MGKKKKKKLNVGTKAVTVNSEKAESAFKTSENFVFSYFRTLLALVLATSWGLAFGWLIHKKTVAQNKYDILSEEDTWGTLRTENAFYYAFYRDVTEAPTLYDGFLRCFWRKDFEYPDLLNAWERLNIAPELLAGVLYRIMSPSSIPMLFYISVRNFIFAIGLSGIAFSGYLLSDSIWGVPLAATIYSFSSFLSQRQAAQPALRENWALSFLYLQLCASYFVINKQKSTLNQLLFIFCSLFMILFWQFGQFICADQVMTIIGMHAIRVIDSSKTSEILFLHLLTLFYSCAILMGNEFLTHSLWFHSIAGAYLTIFISRKLKLRERNWLLQIGVEACSFPTFTVLVSKIQNLIWFPHNEAGGHIMQFILTKFGLEHWMGPMTMHTLLYSTQNVFMTPNMDQPLHFTRNGLLPCAALAVVLILVAFIRKKKSVEPIWIYMLVQTIGNGIIFALIQRFQVLFVPFCLGLATLCFNSKLWWLATSFSIPGGVPGIKPLLLAIGTAIAFHMESGYLLKNFWEYHGPMNEELLSMFKWVRENTPQDVVFGSSIAICGDMFLGTSRNVVVHPQYESGSLRRRYEKISKVTGHRPLEEVWNILRENHVTHIPHYFKACYGASSAGIMVSHLVEEQNKTQIEMHPTPACRNMLKRNRFFKFVWAGKEHWLWEVREKPLKKMPSASGYYGTLGSDSICRFMEHNKDQKIVDQQKLIKIVSGRPDDPVCNCKRARMTEERDPEQAYKMYKSVWKHADVECLNDFSFLLDTALAKKPGAGKESKKVFKKALEINPHAVAIHFNLAYHLAERRKLEEAIKHFEQAVGRPFPSDDHLCTFFNFLHDKHKRRKRSLMTQMLIQNADNPCVKRRFKDVMGYQVPEVTDLMRLKYHLGLLQL